MDDHPGDVVRKLVVRKEPFPPVDRRQPKTPTTASSVLTRAALLPPLDGSPLTRLERAEHRAVHTALVLAVGVLLSEALSEEESPIKPDRYDARWLRSAPMAAPAGSVDGERLRRLTQEIRGPARCVANQLQTPGRRCMVWIEAKTKAPADPAIFQVFDLQQHGATESELLDYAGKHVADKLQAVVLNGWIRDQFHPRSDATVGVTSLGRGGGEVLISKPTSMVQPHPMTSGSGL